METLNEYIGHLVTFCRDNALEELRSNERYIELKQKEKDLRTDLKASMSGEALGLFERYFEAAVAVKGMEFNKVLLCGMTAQAEIGKRFNADADDYKAFETEYLQ